MGTLHTVEEVAARLKLHPQTVHNLIKSGQIERARFGRAIRITEEALQNYIRENSGREGQNDEPQTA